MPPDNDFFDNWVIKNKKKIIILNTEIFRLMKLKESDNPPTPILLYHPDYKEYF